MSVNGRQGGAALVTGAGGLMGSWLSNALLERGTRVVALLRHAPSALGLRLMGIEERVHPVYGDVRDEDLLAATLAEHEVDTVFHLAAQTPVQAAVDTPAHTFDTNIRGTWILLEACRAAGVGRVIVASSDKAYGSPDSLPYREEQRLQPRFPYEVSKAATDMIARSYWHTYGLPVAFTRLSNLYGGGDMNRSRLIPEAVAAALTGRSPVIRSDGTPQRDFLYVEDAVGAYLQLADALARGEACGEAYNAATGRPRSVIEMVEIVCRLAGADVEPDIRGRGIPVGEIDRQYLDSSKLEQLTGWRPRFDVEEGLRRTIEWYRVHAAALAG